MNILALDTSTLALTMALQKDDQTFTRHEIVAREHAKFTLCWLNELLAEADLNLKQLDAISVGCGPGGFTGIRIGMSVVQALALAHDLPVIPVSSLRLLAQTAIESESSKKILVAQDAKMKQVYWAAYQSDENNIAQVVIDDQLCNPDMIQFPDGANWITVGDAWHVYSELQLEQSQYQSSELQYPNATALLTLAKDLFRLNQTVNAENALPVYLRGKDAWKKKTS